MTEKRNSEQSKMEQNTPQLSDDKKIVQDGYDKMAQKYAAWTQDDPRARRQYTETLIERLPPNATVLELGCGSGHPVLETLLKSGANVIANDLSTAMVELAKARCPQATFLPGDMTALDIEPSSLDAVAAFFSVIHLPRQEQPAMLFKIHGWLKDSGLTVFNLAVNDSSEVRGAFFGVDMFWSSFDVESNKKMVEAAGFKLLSAEVLDAGEDLDPSDPDYKRKFLWILAQKTEDSA